MSTIAATRRLLPVPGRQIAKERRLPYGSGGAIARERRLNKDASGYTNAIRSAVRGLWTGEYDYDWFFDSMITAIRSHQLGLPAAWATGAKECGVFPNEYTQPERVALEQAIVYELQWIDGFAGAIEEGSKANGGQLGPLMARAAIWTCRWEGVKAQAMAMACADKKLKWVYGDTQHCSSCAKLNGKIKRASYWNERGILPRVHGADYLSCNGFRCRCVLQPTDEPASKGPLPKLP
jgi:hypothetical protein